MFSISLRLWSGFYAWTICPLSTSVSRLGNLLIQKTITMLLHGYKWKETGQRVTPIMLVTKQYIKYNLWIENPWAENECFL